MCDEIPVTVVYGRVSTEMCGCWRLALLVLVLPARCGGTTVAQMSCTDSSPPIQVIVSSTKVQIKDLDLSSGHLPTRPGLTSVMTGTYATRWELLKNQGSYSFQLPAFGGSDISPRDFVLYAAVKVIGGPSTMTIARCLS